jgi:peptide/nickel transport system substrate-binding protein
MVECIRFTRRWQHSFSSGLSFTAILACLVLAGCTKKSKAAGSPPTPVQSTLYSATDYYEQSPGKAGGTLKVSVSSDTGSLDLHAISHTNAQWLGRLIYDNLVYLDNYGQPTPWLAKSWEISADGKTYTFHLRDDVTFTDGVKFNAEAVRINLEHMRDPATKSPLAAAYIAPYLSGEVVDEYTFRAQLREAYTPFLDVLAQSWLAMESPKALTENPKGFGAAPVGSGPFVVESYTRQQGIKLVRRPDYHWSPDFIRHRGPALLDRVELDFVQEPLVRFSSLAAGQYDLTIDAPPQNAAAIRGDSRLAFDSRVRQGNPNRALAFNTTKFPFDDVRVRKAIALAMDREGIVRVTGFGEFQPKTDFLAENTRYYDPSYKEALKQNVPEANRLLDEAGWTGRDAEGVRTNKDGKHLSAEVLINNTQTPSLVIIALQSDAKKLGVELKLVQRPATELTDRRRSGDYQALGAGVWHTNTPDGLYIVYDSDEITSDKRVGQNISRLSDPELDKALAEARASQSDSDRRRLYSAAQKRLTELVPAIPLHENYTLTARKSDVKGVLYDTSHNTVVFTTVWLDR